MKQPIYYVLWEQRVNYSSDGFITEMSQPNRVSFTIYSSAVKYAKSLTETYPNVRNIVVAKKIDIEEPEKVSPPDCPICHDSYAMVYHENVKKWICHHTHELSSPKPPVEIDADGRCACCCGDPCPLGRVGSLLRCTEEELQSAGFATIRI